MITTFSVIADKSQFATILNKKQNNTNQIIYCNNSIVERIRKLETTIYNNRMMELDNMKVERYGEIKKNKIHITQPIKLGIDEMDVINISMNKLKEWSNKNTSSVIFDSKINDSKDGIVHKVCDKSNLYFITFGTHNNAFGGYLNTNIYGYSC